MFDSTDGQNDLLVKNTWGDNCSFCIKFEFLSQSVSRPDTVPRLNRTEDQYTRSTILGPRESNFDEEIPTFVEIIFLNQGLCQHRTMNTYQ